MKNFKTINPDPDLAYLGVPAEEEFAIYASERGAVSKRLIALAEEIAAGREHCKQCNLLRILCPRGLCEACREDR